MYLSGEYYFVRKISKSVDYNERLENQMKKQIFFYENLATEKITTPKILECGQEGELFYFDMEYIKGITLIEQVFNSKPEELLETVEFIKKVMKIFGGEKKIQKLDVSEMVKAKLTEIKNKTFLDENTYGCLMNYSEFLPKVGSTECHGDLTLENVIYDEKNKKYFLIDFLDNFADHYWFDIAKIFQDFCDR